MLDISERVIILIFKDTGEPVKLVEILLKLIFKYFSSGRISVALGVKEYYRVPWRETALFDY